MKGRPNCLQSSLRVQPCIFIAAYMILHNIAKMLNEEDFDGDDDEDFDGDDGEDIDGDNDEDFECHAVGARQDSSNGKVVRSHITNTFFA